MTLQLIGVRRPIVLVPVAPALTSDERAMAFCHELVHIRRHDLVLGWVPALAERLFFFHPLVRLAVREYVTAREAACDAAVVRALDVSPALYARMLVRIGVAERETVFAAGGASPSKASLRRRLEMLQHVDAAAIPRRVSCSLAVVLFAAMVPLQLVARGSSADGQITPRLEQRHHAPLTPTGEAAAVKQQSLGERRHVVEVQPRALDAKAQRAQHLLRQTITRETVEKERRQLGQVASEQEALKRRQQDDKVATQSEKYSRGDVVELTPAQDGTRLPESRVLAIPGDHIRVARAGIVVNGASVTELSPDFLAGLPEDIWEQAVPPDHYFVAAEQRAKTGVTRFWGLIPAKRIGGRR